jgi:hypothetical protein
MQSHEEEDQPDQFHRYASPGSPRYHCHDDERVEEMLRWKRRSKSVTFMETTVHVFSTREPGSSKSVDICRNRPPTDGRLKIFLPSEIEERAHSMKKFVSEDQPHMEIHASPSSKDGKLQKEGRGVWGKVKSLFRTKNSRTRGGLDAAASFAYVSQGSRMVHYGVDGNTVDMF